MNQRIQLLKEKWRKLGIPIKICIGTVGLALIIFLFFSFFMPNKYQVLYSGLDKKDEADIEKYLADSGIDYQVDDKTQTINVNGDIIKIKKDLALQGLPKGGTTGGLDQFNNMSLGATKYDKDVQYQNALQNELDNSLSDMFDAIQSADVKLPKPEDQSIFSDQNKPIQVSVALKLRPGYQLTPQQVKAVQVYVAGAINNVKPSDVQVVDQDLNPLSSTDTNDTSVTKQQQIENETKRKMETQLESALSEVYGRVRVIVSVDINFDEIVKNIKKYDPQGTLLSKQEDTDRTRTITGNDAVIPGTDTNGEVPRYDTSKVNNKNLLSVEDKGSVIQNFKVGETAEKIVQQPELRNTNIVVWFDNTQLTQQQLYDAEEMVAVASGLTGTVNRVANDKAVYANGSVKVVQTKFAQKLSNTTTKQTQNSIFSQIPWYAYVGAGLLLLILIAVIVVLIVRSKKNKKESEEEEEKILGKQEISEGTEQGEFIAEDIDNKTSEEIEEEIFNSLGGKFNIEWSQDQKDLRKLTNEVAKKYPKETADVISKIMKK